MTISRLIRPAVAAVTVAVLAAACGTSEGDGAAEPTDDTVPATSPSTEPTDTSSAPEDDLDILLTTSAGLSETDPTVSLLVALEANRRSPTAATEEAVLNALRSNTGISTEVVNKLAPPDCSSPTASEDGEQIYVVADGRFMRYDVSTGEAIDHGPSADNCAVWLGDVEAGQRVTVDTLDTRTWTVGPIDGPGGIDLQVDRDIGISGRTLIGDRVAFTAPEPTGLSYLLFDTTTGELVTEQNGLAAPWSTFGGDGTVVVYTTTVPGAGGQLVVLDAQTGEEQQRVDIVAPGNESRFDLTTGEVVIPTAGGRLLTVDIESGTVVSDVPTAASARVVAVGIRPDGLVVIAREDMIEIVDRRTGPTGVMVASDEYFAMRVRPDGSVMRVLENADVEVVNIDVNGLAGKSDDEWLDMACDIAERDLTQAEWDLHISDDEPLQATCS